MVRHSRRSRRGGDKLDDIQSQLDNIQQQVNELKSSPSSSMPEPVSESMPETMQEAMPEPAAAVSKPWVTDKNKKFTDGMGGRVTLSFSRIMDLLDKNIKKGDTTKDWATIKQKLMDANSTGDVQSVIDEYKVRLASNYVAGTRRKRRHGGKRTHRRR